MKVKIPENNKDDMKEAIHGLAIFCHNFCMNCEQTEKQNDLVCRCKACPFKNGYFCRIKEFVSQYGEPGDKEKVDCMGEL